MPECEACGSTEDICGAYTGHPAVDERDLIGAKLCRRCATSLGPNANGRLADSIRSRRATLFPSPAKPPEWCAQCGYGYGAYGHLDSCPAKPPGGEVEHQCARNGMHLMKNERCVECGRTNEQMRFDGLQVHEAPAPKRVRPDPLKESTAPPTLAAFAASVEQHLVPLLPKSLRGVTDIVHRYDRVPLSRPRPHCWVMNGATVLHEFGGWPFEAEHAASVASDIARLLMADLACKSKEGK